MPDESTPLLDQTDTPTSNGHLNGDIASVEQQQPKTRSYFIYVCAIPFPCSSSLISLAGNTHGYRRFPDSDGQHFSDLE